MIELKPTHPDVLKAIALIEETLTEMEVLHFTEQDADNPDLWSVGSAEYPEDDPETPIIHMGFVGLNANTKTVSFAGYDAGRTARNEKEGIDGDEGLEMVDLKKIDMMVLWLTGDFHRILRSAEEKMRKMDEAAKKAAPGMAADIIASVTEAQP
jgi:hypothetical protein